MAGKRVLIVEDDAIIGWHLERSLCDLGYHVIGVLDNGENAIAAAVIDPPDLALMDVGLKGGLDGIETAKLLHLKLDVPVIFLTAYTDMITLERAKASNPYGYLRKPFDDQSLRATIEMALHKHSLERELTESEQRYRMLFGSMQEGFALHEIILNDQGRPVDYRFLDVNPAFEALTGLKADEVVGKTVLDVLPGTEATWIDTYGQVALGGVPVSFESYTQPLNKYFRVAVFSPKQGQFATLFSDITQSKQMELSLRANEKRLRTLTAASTSYIFELDAKGLIRFVNKPLPGVTLEEMIESSLLRWFPGSLRQMIQSTLDGVFHDGKVNSLEFTFPNAMGEQRSYIAQIIPIVGEHGIEIAVMTATDITEQERAEMALAEERSLLARRVEERTADLSIANAQLARAARMKDEFLASMSHELRTPLTGVLGLSEALQKNVYGDLNERQQKALENIEESGAHLLSLINDILDLSKIEAGRLELDIRPVALQSVSKASMRLVHQAADKKHIELDLVFDPAAEVMMMDERRLKQILVNLLSNAVKFTPENGRIQVAVRLDAQRNTVEFAVSDTGIGIKKSEIERLFQPFVQLDSGLSRPYPGTGLGLSLVMKLVELYGGGIYVESEPGKGSKFSVILPWKPVSNETLAAWVQTRQIVSLDGEKKAQSVLIIEDTRAAANQLPRILRENNCEVRVWQHEEAPFELAMSMKPDLIFMDVLLPGLSGWDLLAQLKSDPNISSIPVVIVSVLDERIRGIALGAIDYLVKPFSPQQVSEVLRKVLIGRGKGTTTHAQRVTGLKGKVVLIAEDNDLTLNTVMDFLIAQGCQVISARNGTEVIELARECRPDVILMDIQMPGMDGIEATRRIRSNEDNGRVPIIALTALAMAGDRERCMSVGMDDYLSKPVSFEQLSATILANVGRV
jgi:PAS domain S-box-containing protein